jgi:hypothetical protein
VGADALAKTIACRLAIGAKKLRLPAKAAANLLRYSQRIGPCHRQFTPVSAILGLSIIASILRLGAGQMIGAGPSENFFPFWRPLPAIALLPVQHSKAKSIKETRDRSRAP